MANMQRKKDAERATHAALLAKMGEQAMGQDAADASMTPAARDKLEKENGKEEKCSK